MKNIIYFIIAIALTALAYTSFIKDPSAPLISASPALNDTNTFDALSSEAAEGAEVFIIEPLNGTRTTSPVTIKFGVRNMTIAKAGDPTEFSGHHHLLINLDELPALNKPLPATEQIIHFGGAQTETTIALASGQHSLQLLLGNYLHIPHNTPVLSEKISIIIE